MTAQKAVNRIREEILRLTRDKNEKAAAERLAAQSSSPQLSTPAKLIPGAKRSESGIIVEGLDNCLVKFAKCCTPVPGDPVVASSPGASACPSPGRLPQRRPHPPQAGGGGPLGEGELGRERTGRLRDLSGDLCQGPGQHAI